MKTYEEFRREVMADIKRSEEMSLKPKEYSYAQIETMAAKEYAKQWIYRFVDKIDWVDENFGSDIVEICEEIDAQ